MTPSLNQLKYKKKSTKNKMSMQLELFPETETERLARELADLKVEMGRLRKGIFARHTELERFYNELDEQMQEIKNG
jgi:SMC interacting uncharacterized protein involved in chromosome segregation